MYLNFLLWFAIAVFVGIIGYLWEVNKKKHLGSNIVASFFGVIPSAFIVYFLIWPQYNDSINVAAAVTSIFFGLLAVKLEDYVFLRV
jgi:uncharacterized membrane protein YjjB (DUF3815 family)